MGPGLAEYRARPLGWPEPEAWSPGCCCLTVIFSVGEPDLAGLLCGECFLLLGDLDLRRGEWNLLFRGEFLDGDFEKLLGDLLLEEDLLLDGDLLFEGDLLLDGDLLFRGDLLDDLDLLGDKDRLFKVDLLGDLDILPGDRLLSGDLDLAHGEGERISQEQYRTFILNLTSLVEVNQAN